MIHNETLELEGKALKMFCTVRLKEEEPVIYHKLYLMCKLYL